MLLLTLLLSTFVHAETRTFLTLQRLNYKPEKRLHYALSFDSRRCELNRAAPFDVYYVDSATGQRLDEFSSDSQKYFGPRIDGSRLGARQVALEFRALDEIQNATGVRADILVRIAPIGGRCAIEAEVTYRNRRYSLQHLDVHMKKVLGIPSGVNWVRLKGHDDNGPVNDCVGSC